MIKIMEETIFFTNKVENMLVEIVGGCVFVTCF